MLNESIVSGCRARAVEVLEAHHRHDPVAVELAKDVLTLCRNSDDWLRYTDSSEQAATKKIHVEAF